jgi:hypothetical protein
MQKVSLTGSTCHKLSEYNCQLVNIKSLQIETLMRSKPARAHKSEMAIWEEIITLHISKDNGSAELANYNFSMFT